MRNQFALITGASSGIGEAFARKLASDQYNLIITARRKNKLEQLANELIDQYGVQVKVVVADLTSSDGIDQVAQEIIACKDLYYLINNAGFANVGEFDSIKWEKHQNMLSLHVTAPTLLAYTALAVMKKNNSGVIINVSSVGAFMSGNNLYRPTKAFQVSLTRTLKLVTKGTNIIVQALCPGYTYSGFHQTDEYIGRNVYNEIPKMLWMTSEQVVNKSLKAVKKKKTVVFTSFRYRIVVKLINLGLLFRPKPKSREQPKNQK
ncbi:MAG: SDR family NAD(P)-dependent oxidoreductase [Candidatus Kariarchaeaceae archaeon]|jgi:short-subunit dehydrogenase